MESEVDSVDEVINILEEFHKATVNLISIVDKIDPDENLTAFLESVVDEEKAKKINELVHGLEQLMEEL